jgi:putative DNA methylase
VRAALVIINQCLDEVLAEQEGELDADTRWAIAWFSQYGMEEGPYGTAETLSRAMNTSVEGMMRAGVIRAVAGKVRLLRRDELPADWSPSTDSRLTVWETAQHLIHTLQNQGEFAAAALLTAAGSTAESARDLAYRLYTICERKGWASEALAYNSLVPAWSGLGDAATRVEAARGAPVQGTLAGL